MEREDALDAYLSELRRTAKLSVEQVCQSTKIQARYVEALEAGAWGEVPSNTHLRAFSLSIANACGGDPERAALLVRRVLAATAPVAPGTKSFDTPAPAPVVLRPAPTAAKPAATVTASAATMPTGAGAAPPLLVADGPAVPAAAIPANGLVAASARLRSLPLTALLVLLALAGALSYGAAWGVEQWKHHLDVAALNSAAPSTGSGQAPVTLPGSAKSGDTALRVGAEKFPAKAGSSAGSGQAPLAVAADNAAPGAAAPVELTLRARRACWLVLSIDGKRLPTVTLQDGDKLSWKVDQKAVLLAGNVGALRVWWRGDNLGYLGELGQRANAIVFERGRDPRSDKTAALPLPSGVPE